MITIQVIVAKKVYGMRLLVNDIEFVDSKDEK